MRDSDSLHIVFFIQDLYKLGAQFATAKLANSLSNHGQQVEVVVSAVHNELVKNRSDLKSYKISPKVVFESLPNKKASLNFLAIFQYLKKNKPDVVIATAENYLIPISLALFLLNSSSKLVFIEHSSGIGMKGTGVEFKIGKINYHQSFIRKFTGNLLWHLTKLRIDRIVAVSLGVKEALISSRGVHASHISVIPNPVIDDDDICLSNMLTPLHPWLINKTTPVIIAAGAHVPFKAFDVLIKGFACVRLKYDCRLIIFGEGPLTESLKALANTLGVGAHIDFPGFTTNLPAELSQADCFVVSSNVESFSIVLVQALACRVPVVATDCPSGPKEILREGKYGILTRTGDSKDLAAGISRVLDGSGIIPPYESWQAYRSDNVRRQFEILFRQDL